MMTLSDDFKKVMKTQMRDHVRIAAPWFSDESEAKSSVADFMSGLIAGYIWMVEHSDESPADILSLTIDLENECEYLCSEFCRYMDKLKAAPTLEDKLLVKAKQVLADSEA